jgi:hypothetical protein
LKLERFLEKNTRKFQPSPPTHNSCPTATIDNQKESETFQPSPRKPENFAPGKRAKRFLIFSLPPTEASAYTSNCILFFYEKKAKIFAFV